MIFANTKAEYKKLWAIADKKESAVLFVSALSRADSIQLPLSIQTLVSSSRVELEKNNYRAKKFKLENPERVKVFEKRTRERHKPRRYALTAEWRKANKERVRVINNAGKKKRRATNPAFQFELSARNRVWYALHAQHAVKACRGLELLGVTSREEAWIKLKEKFSGRFPHGVYGKNWEWDHIRPCASFDLTDPAQQRICFHWTNYQPLPVFENRSKGAKWTPEEK